MSRYLVTTLLIGHTETTVTFERMDHAGIPSCHVSFRHRMIPVRLLMTKSGSGAWVFDKQKNSFRIYQDLFDYTINKLEQNNKLDSLVARINTEFQQTMPMYGHATLITYTPVSAHASLNYHLKFEHDSKPWHLVMERLPGKWSLVREKVSERFWICEPVFVSTILMNQSRLMKEHLSSFHLDK